MKRFLAVLTGVFALCLIISCVYAEDQAPAAAPAPEAATTATAPAAAPAPAAEQPKVEEAKVTGSAALAVLSQYIFRGYELSAHSVVIQPTVVLNYKGFSFTYWGNLDTKERATQSLSPEAPGQKSYNETDLTLSYTYNIDKLGLTGGYIYYGTSYAKQTQELFVSATYDMIGHPTISINQDIDSYSGTYINLSLSQSLPVYKLSTGDITVDLGAGFGYEIGQGNSWNTFDQSKGIFDGPKYSEFHDGHVQVGLSFPLGKNVVLQPIAQYWFPLSNKASEAIATSPNGSYNPNGKLDNTFVYGMNLTMSF